MKACGFWIIEYDFAVSGGQQIITDQLKHASSPARPGTFVNNSMENAHFMRAYSNVKGMPNYGGTVKYFYANIEPDCFFSFCKEILLFLVCVFVLFF